MSRDIPSLLRLIKTPTEYKLEIFDKSQVETNYNASFLRSCYECYHKSGVLRLTKMVHNSEFYGTQVLQFMWSDMTTGCGIMLISQWANTTLFDEYSKEVFERFIKSLYDGSYTPGMLILTKGHTYSDRFANFHGFIKLKTYDNLAHGKQGGYEQDLMGRILKPIKVIR